MLLRSAATRRRDAAAGATAGIAISCRVRLARNLDGDKFPEWADEAARRAVFDRVAPWLAREAGIPQARIVPVGDLDEVTRGLLRERRLISRELAEGGPGSGLVVSDDERVAVMINEEDHLRIQVIEPGMDLHRAWATADALDTGLERQFPYAFSGKLGYLTACPSNVGTGLRASVMVHLLGLRLANDLDAVLRALERLRLTVRGVGGEGSEAAGHMFQISNQETLGEDEMALIDDLLDVVGDVVQQERNARLRLRRDSPEILLDCVARALAIIQSARVMETEEALDYLCALRLGVSMGLVRRLTIREIDALTLAIQPGHLQRTLGKTLEPPRRDIVRANVMRELLARAALG
jgi:protein arginine kinase